MDLHKLICCGGFEGRFYLDDVECYDWFNDLWTPLPRMPVACNSTSTSACEKKIILAGGDTGRNVTDAVNMLDTEDFGEWKALTSLPSARAYSASYLQHNCLVVCGGGYDDVIMDNVEALDLHTGRWRVFPNMPSKRSKCGYAIIGDGRFILAGGEERSHTPTDKVMCLYTREEKWEHLPPLSVPRRRCSAVTWGDNIVVIGGLTSGNQTVDTIELFDFRSMKWQTLTQMRSLRYGFGSAVLGDQLFIAGGSEKLRMKVYHDDVEVLNLTTLNWESLQPISKKKIHPSLVAIS